MSTALDRMNERMWALPAVVAAMLLCAVAAAQDARGYPGKPIKIIVPFTPGSATDVVARLLGDKLSSTWGQPVIVDNRAGAGGTIGIAQTAKADPDGYTLAVVSAGHVVNDVLYKDLQYDTLQDLAGGRAARQPVKRSHRLAHAWRPVREGAGGGGEGQARRVQLRYRRYR